MALEPIVIAVDDMEEWSEKINADIAQTNTNTADIATNTADIATNTADIATNTADITDLQDGPAIYDKIQLNTAGGQAHSPGQLSYDAVSKTILADVGFDSVRVNLGQEMQVRFFNSGAPILNGTVINGGGVDPVNNVVIGTAADTSSPATSSVILGVATMDVPTGEVGIATRYGEVRDVATGSLVAGGVLYASASGGFQGTFPNYPSRVVILGTVIKESSTPSAKDGIIFVDSQVFNRGTGSRSYAFSQANLGVGLYYLAGFYEAVDQSAQTLTNPSGSSLTFGSANVAHGAHYFIVLGAITNPDAGIVAIQVTGNAWNDSTGTGAPISNPTTEIIVGTGSTTGIADISELTTNQYIETTKKFNGTVTVEVIAEGGLATTWSVEFNHGWAKYEDLNNTDFSLTGLEFVGRANSATAGFEIKVYHHNGVGWVFNDGSFIPGGTVYASWQEDLTPDFKVGATGEPFAWKRAGGTGAYIQGSESEGIVISINCPSTNTVSYMNAHVSGVIEQLVF
jgi:hypothetical protein